jgi:outer membrane protein TolC
LQIDIPVETNQKHFIRTEEAQHLAEVARMDIADVAWRLRYQLTLNITEYRAYIADLKHAKHIHNIHLEILKMLEKRLQLGLASQTEVLTARLNTQRQMAGIHQIESAIEKVIYQIAQNTGLPVSEIQRLPISLVDIDTQLQTFDQQFKQSTDLSAYREAALLNRIDIRRGIANYAASEAKLKLEIAKQIPDISLSPGVLYEYGDKIWSLGFASLFNLLKGNATLIKQAESLRDIEGANFLALQSSVIHTIEQQIQLYLSLKQKHDDAESILVKDRAYFHRLQKQFEAGQIDRLELTVASAVLAQQASTVDRLKLDNIRQIYEIENSLQHPLLVESGQIFNANFSEIVVPIYE